MDISIPSLASVARELRETCSQLVHGGYNDDQENEETLFHYRRRLRGIVGFDERVGRTGHLRARGKVQRTSENWVGLLCETHSLLGGEESPQLLGESHASLPLPNLHLASLVRHQAELLSLGLPNLIHDLTQHLGELDEAVLSLLLFDAHATELDILVGSDRTLRVTSEVEGGRLREREQLVAVAETVELGRLGDGDKLDKGRLGSEDSSGVTVVEWRTSQPSHNRRGRTDSGRETYTVMLGSGDGCVGAVRASKGLLSGADDADTG